MKVTNLAFNFPKYGNARLLAFCNVTFDDCLVVEGYKVINGPDGVFLAMPCRKIMDYCEKCNGKNVLRARFCSWCGIEIDPIEVEKERDTYNDIVYSRDKEFTHALEKHIIEALEAIKGINYRQVA